MMGLATLRAGLCLFAAIGVLASPAHSQAPPTVGKAEEWHGLVLDDYTLTILSCI